MIGSNYKAYIKEREKLDVIEYDFGFIIYRIEDDSIWINDYYVAPWFRKKGAGKTLADKVLKLAVELKIPMVRCQSDESANGHDISRAAILNYGFIEIARAGTIIYYELRVDKWEKQ